MAAVEGGSGVYSTSISRPLVASYNVASAPKSQRFTENETPFESSHSRTVCTCLKGV